MEGLNALTAELVEKGRVVKGRVVPTASVERDNDGDVLAGKNVYCYGKSQSEGEEELSHDGVLLSIVHSE